MRRQIYAASPVRRRLRELGFAVGRFPTGERNALVDVPGVLVGHRTLVEGDRLRTGVTAILPHGGNLYAEKVLGACHTINGYGKAAGLSQLAELGHDREPAAADLHAVGRAGAGRAACAICSTPTPTRRSTATRST